ncbi:hypothetical protein A2454_05680 [Candidatus Peribacteria bacterium RIFOXYC2_FULL_55_14]|nr:MAG: hypothetical protein UY90_C0028G0010 [Candidatus Peregrinibacteria bacterium GW2011_GWA2_54_9]OGJ72052.1 MAG: hypothetical protein A2198_04235 [Candidatus Peribacteria bacterium RIFOXYA1_FULL_56_14]OGJ74065.1 MAG: hypothetical protein A2217_00255 [Candidatus Peribacteria bacterium RIFOXYA2_FULL_55_28]OGJ75496.1 MAG: hypothetical protein A2384_01215 [Candidatus Peribacteria bacterium RIFOXYB1_FULL_54_35]OGJ76328.1 MAG: hypothetical protein A2327_00655 [Candidatus Peribacteria bacterium R
MSTKTSSYDSAFTDFSDEALSALGGLGDINDRFRKKSMWVSRERLPVGDFSGTNGCVPFDTVNALIGEKLPRRDKMIQVHQDRGYPKVMYMSFATDANDVIHKFDFALSRSEMLSSVLAFFLLPLTSLDITFVLFGCSLVFYSLIKGSIAVKSDTPFKFLVSLAKNIAICIAILYGSGFMELYFISIGHGVYGGGVVREIVLYAVTAYLLSVVAINLFVWFCHLVTEDKFYTAVKDIIAYAKKRFCEKE